MLPEAPPTPLDPALEAWADEAYYAALKTWTDEITEGGKWLAGCLYEADHETDAATRERRRAGCVEQFRARMKANDERFEERKRDIAK